MFTTTLLLSIISLSLVNAACTDAACCEKYEEGDNDCLGCNADSGCSAWQLYGGTSEATAFECRVAGEDGPAGYTAVDAPSDCKKQIEDACEAVESCGKCTSEKVLTDYNNGGFSCKYCNTGAKVGIDTGTCSYECISDKVSIANADCGAEDATTESSDGGCESYEEGDNDCLGCFADDGCTAWQLFGGTDEASAFDCLPKGAEGKTGYTAVKKATECGKQIEDACEALERCEKCTSEKVLTDYNNGGFSCKYCNTGSVVGIDTGTCGYRCVSDKVSIPNNECNDATTIVASFAVVVGALIAQF